MPTRNQYVRHGARPPLPVASKVLDAHRTADASNACAMIRRGAAGCAMLAARPAHGRAAPAGAARRLRTGAPRGGAAPGTPHGGMRG